MSIFLILHVNPDDEDGGIILAGQQEDPTLLLAFLMKYMIDEGDIGKFWEK